METHSRNTATSNSNSNSDQIKKEIPFFDASSRSINYLQKTNLFPCCLNNEVLFKQLVCHLMMTVCQQPYNAALILNLSIPLPMYRTSMMEKFRKLDHILSIVIKPLGVTHKALGQRYKNCHYKDIVAHYTRYQYVVHNDGDGLKKRFIRKNVLGQNSNLDQFVKAVSDHLACDHKQFLTVSAIQLTTSDMDLLCSRYFCICEALSSFEFAHEILVDESRYYKDILAYLQKFIEYCFRIHLVQHDDFGGLNSDHLKLLLTGTVLLEIGWRTQKPVYRLHLMVTEKNQDMLETKLIELRKDMSKMDRDNFELRKQIVDFTPGSKNVHFRKDIEKYFEAMYGAFKQFLMASTL